MKSYCRWAVADPVVHRVGGKVTYIQMAAFGSSGQPKVEGNCVLHPQGNLTSWLSEVRKEFPVGLWLIPFLLSP